MKVIIIGGVAGGATAAARIRRLDEQAEIVIYERSGFVSYANCGLPYYIGDVITQEEALSLQSPEGFFRRFRVHVRLQHEVTEILPASKKIKVKKLVSGEIFEDSYDKLILSPGAKPIQPEVQGLESEGVFTLRTVEDSLRIKKYIREHKPNSLVLSGGGFIGLELAENLRELGLEVSIVQRPRQLMKYFDPDMAAFIHKQLREKGINLILGHSVLGFEKKADGIDVLIKDAAALHADMAVLAVGVNPDTELAKAAGLELGIKGSIVVNDRMETSAPDIYAVGDAVQIKHYVSGQDALVSLAGPANKQARIAADNICGRSSRYKGALGSNVTKLFDMTVASTGLSETAAKTAGFDTDKVILSPLNHAGYYPGAREMTMKLVYEKGSFRLLGAQIIGYEGVDKRIDVLAAAIYSGLEIDELRELDLAYAPPYGSAKDAVNMAGYIADNIRQGLIKQKHFEEIKPYAENATLLDVRTAREYSAGHFEGFINIPIDELRERIAELDSAKPIYTICHSGVRSHSASRILSNLGFDVYNIPGGYRFHSVVMQEKKLSGM